MQDYLLQPAIFEAFIAHAYGVRYDGLWQHFSFDTIKVLAQINNLHVIIKRLSADGTCYETIREYPAEDAPVFVMLHTMAGTKNGLHPSGGQALNHFNLLSMHRGILVSPTITYSHVHNVLKSKSTSIGAQVSPGSAIPGSASFGHDKKNKQSDTLATISSNIHQVTNSDTSGVNQDVKKMTRDGKNTGTHVNIHAPAIPFGNVGELWNQAKANAGIVADRVLGIPVETFAPPQIVRKEEPEDTSITDAEADAIMDDLETQGKKQEAERKAQERRAAEKAVAEKKEAAESIFNAPIKTETDWTVSILDTESRGRPQERIIREVEDTAPLITPGWDAPEKEVSPTRPLKDTTTAVGKEVVGGTFSEVYENRDKLKNGEITPLNVQSALMAYGLDGLSYAVQGLDLATGGAVSWAGESLDAGAEKAGTIVRRAARQVTGNQRFGQELGEYVCLGLMTANPFNKAMLPAQVTQKLMAANNAVKSTKAFEVLNLGKAANVESKVLHGLDLAEGAGNKGIYNPHAIREALEARYPGQVTSSTVPLPNQKNVKLAGQRHPETGIVFDQRGFPIFDDIAKFDTRVEHEIALGGISGAHKRAATRNLRETLNSSNPGYLLFNQNQIQAIELGLERIPGFTWHHHQDIGRMQLIPDTVNKVDNILNTENANKILNAHKDTGHIGGMNMWPKKRDN